MVDLIPEDYRRAQRLLRGVRAFALASAALIALAVLGHFTLRHLARGDQARLDALRREQAANSAQHARLAALRVRTEHARQHLQALRSLSAPSAVTRLFFAIDTAIPQQVWFDEFSFDRDGKTTAPAPGAPPPGHVVPVKPAGATARGSAPAAGRPGPGRAAVAQERANIHGQAIDHAALALFIRRLGEQPGIAQVRLVDTSMHAAAKLQVVDFRLSVMLAPPAGAPR